MQNVVGPTLVAMATKFELGAEIQSPTGLSSITVYLLATVGLYIIIHISIFFVTLEVMSSYRFHIFTISD